MRRSVTFEANVLRDDWFGDIDERNSRVDEVVDKQKWCNDDRIAQCIEYEVLKCKRNGDAKIKATFNYE